jgi:hypothetical protein
MELHHSSEQEAPKKVTKLFLNMTLGVADQSSYAEGAAVFIKALSSQTDLPWPDAFPGKIGATEAA